MREFLGVTGSLPQLGLYGWKNAKERQRLLGDGGGVVGLDGVVWFGGVVGVVVRRH